MTFKAAFYKGIRPGLEGVYSVGVHWWTRSPYSHCEFAFTDGLSGSASYIDGGVRLKHITYSSANWDFIELPAAWESDIRTEFEKYIGCKYDILGNFGFVIPSFGDSKNKYFCSEIFMKLLGAEKPELYTPGLAYYTTKLMVEKL